MSDLRIAFLAWLQAQEGKPYVWGGKGMAAFDCSGLVTAGFQAVGVPGWGDFERLHVYSAALWKNLPDVETPLPGDLAFYGAPHIRHVMVWWGDGRVLGACGGGSTTTTVEEAARRRARVQFRPTHLYRPDFRGFRVSPLDETNKKEKVA